MPFASSSQGLQRPAERRVAIVLNANARAVTDDVIRRVHSLAIDHNDIFVSRSLEHAKFIAHQIVRHRYDAVVSGGGDGTFSQVVSDIAALRPRRMPAFGVLRLGTGNAMATALGAADSSVRGMGADLNRTRDPRAERDLNMLTVDGRVAPFAGVGVDSLILSDYNAVKRSVSGTPLSNMMQGGAGYAAAIATRSFWRFTLGSLPVVTIRNDGLPADRVDLQGQAIGAPIPRGGIIYNGPVAIAAASTIPYYGLGLRAFPQVDQRTDRFQLRVANVGALDLVMRMRSVFRGTYDHPRLHDFLCTSVTIEVNQPTPFQVGGDEIGTLRELHIGMRRLRAVCGSEQPLAVMRPVAGARRVAA